MNVELMDRPVWSRSQLTALTECERKLALSQKASRDAAVDPVYARAHTLKKMKNRHLWTGSLAHEAIGDLLKLLRQGEPLPEAGAVIERAREKMRGEFRASKDAQSDAPRLFEHEFNHVVAPEVWKAHWTTIESSLRWFLQSKWIKRLGTLGPECWKAVDETLEFDVNGVKAYVKIDCALDVDGKFVLVDWKTRAPGADAEFPLLVAALYAYETWGAQPDTTQAMAVSLVDGQTFHARIDEEALMNAHMRIEEEATRLHDAKSQFSANPLAVAMTENRQTCRRCNFQSLCFSNGVPHAI